MAINEISTEQAIEMLWSIGDLTYLFNENQEIVYDELKKMQGREICLLLARRYGKSYFAIIYAAMMCLQNEDLRVGVVAKDKEQVRRIIHPITEWLIAQAPSGFIRKTTSRFELVFPRTNSNILILGAEASAENYRGMGLDLAILEETASFEPHHYINMMKYILKPMLRKSKQPIKIIHCTTPSPKYTDHPFHQDMASMPNLKLTIFEDKTATEEQIQECIDDCGGVDSHAFRVEYLCEITRNEQFTCLPDFNGDCVSDKKIMGFTVGSFDLGGTRDKSAYLEAVITASSIVVNHYKLFPNMTPIDEIADYLKTRKTNYLIGDVSGQSAIEFEQRDITFHFPSKTDFEVMIQELNAGFLKKEILVHESLEDLIECCTTSMFNDKRTDFLRTDKFGHADPIAALNYLYRMRKSFYDSIKRALKDKRDSYYSPNDNSIVHQSRVKREREKFKEAILGKQRNYTRW